MGSIFISFLLPQAFALIKNPGQVSQQALERVLLFSCLCAAACWVGYKIQPNKKWLSKLNIPLDESKLFRAGIALMAIGYLSIFLLSSTRIQKGANGNWTGPATIYVFFGQVIYIAFAIFILQTLKRPNTINLFCTAIASIPLVETIFLNGRRQPTMTLLVIVGLAFWLVRRYIPPRWLFIVAIIATAYLIPLIGELRGNFWNLLLSDNRRELIVSSQMALNSVLKGNILELRNAALLMDATEQTSRYGYGTGFWDSIIFQYVPGQILGYDFKKSLQFHLTPYDLLGDLYGYLIPNGSTVTGIGDSFMEFGYFGCLCFLLIGILFKNLWLSSVYYESTVARLLYMGMVSPAMVGLTHGIGRFLQEMIFQFICISLVVFFSKNRYSFYYIKSETWRMDEY
jgi:hypothetical protein